MAGRQLCFLAVPLRCSWATQQSDVEGEGRAALGPPLLQPSNGALSAFPTAARSPSAEEAQREARRTLPLEKLHSPLLKHIFPQILWILTAVLPKKGTTANLKYDFTLLYFIPR